jgi:hypothetical protein
MAQLQDAIEAVRNFPCCASMIRVSCPRTALLASGSILAGVWARTTGPGEHFGPLFISYRGKTPLASDGIEPAAILLIAI